MQYKKPILGRQSGCCRLRISTLDISKVQNISYAQLMHSTQIQVHLENTV